MSSHLSPDQLQAKAASYPESPSQDQQQSQQQQQPSALERIASTISSTFSSAVNAIGHFTHHEQTPDDDANPPAVAQSGSSAEGYWDTDATSPSSPAAELKENAVDVYPNVSHQQLISSAMSGVKLDQDVHSSAASRARDDHQRGKDTHLGSTQSQDEDDKRDVQYIA
ncbi:hypothetical protein RI367_002419 [Sorochytrium milnesiophthora]